MLSCAAAAALTRAQPELRCYREFQTREAAESALILEMHYHSFKDQEEHQQIAVELAAALADGTGALLTFAYRASRELLDARLLLVPCETKHRNPQLALLYKALHRKE